MALSDYCFMRNNRCLACGMFLLRNGNGRTDIFYMLEHKNRIFLRVFKILEEEKRFFVIT